MAKEQGTEQEAGTEEKVAPEQVEVVAETDEILSEEDQAYFDGGGADESEVSGGRKADEDAEGEGEKKEESKEPEGESGASKDGDKEAGKNLDPVPYQRFSQKVAELAESKAQNESERNRFDKILSMVNKSAEAPKEAETEEEEVVIPPYEDGEAEHLKARQDLTDKKLAEAEQERTATKEQQEQQERFDKFDEAVGVEVNKFIETQPDYPEAFNHLVESRMKELATIGLTPDQINNQIVKENRNISITAAQQGKNPGEVAYALAIGRGYVKAPGDGENGDGGSPEVDKATAEAKAKIENIQKGIDKNVSLGGSGGEGESKKRLEYALSMPDDEFNKLSAKEVESLLGG